MPKKTIVYIDDASWFSGRRKRDTSKTIEAKSRLQELPIPPQHIQRRDLLTLWYEAYYIARMSGAVEEASIDYATAVVEGRSDISTARLRAYLEKYDPNALHYPAGTKKVVAGRLAGGTFMPKNGEGKTGAKKASAKKPADKKPRRKDLGPKPDHAKPTKPAAEKPEEAQRPYDWLSEEEKKELYLQYTLANPILDAYEDEGVLPEWIVGDLTEEDILRTFDGDPPLDKIDIDVDALNDEALDKYNQWVENSPGASEQRHRDAYLWLRTEMEKPMAERFPETDEDGSVSRVFGSVPGAERHESLATEIEADTHMTHRDWINDGINTTYVFGHDDGDYFVKEMTSGRQDEVTEAAAEVATANIAEVMGMTTTENRDGGFILPVWDVSGPDAVRIATTYEAGVPFGAESSDFRNQYMDGMSSQELTNMLVFDYLTGQRDRHTYNVFYREADDQLLLIDNGFSFVEDGGGRFQVSSHDSRLPGHAIRKHTSDSRVLSPLSMRNFVAKRDEIIAVVPDILDPEGFGDRLLMVEFLAGSPNPITVGDFYLMMRDGLLDTRAVGQRDAESDERLSVRLQTLEKYNPGPYVREPAGTHEGGQFAEVGVQERLPGMTPLPRGRFGGLPRGEVNWAGQRQLWKNRDRRRMKARENQLAADRREQKRLDEEAGLPTDEKALREAQREAMMGRQDTMNAFHEELLQLRRDQERDAAQQRADKREADRQQANAAQKKRIVIRDKQMAERQKQMAEVKERIRVAEEMGIQEGARNERLVSALERERVLSSEIHSLKRGRPTADQAVRLAEAEAELAALDIKVTRLQARGINSGHSLVELGDEKFFIKSVGNMHAISEIVEATAELTVAEYGEILGMGDAVMPVWDVSDRGTTRIAMSFVEGSPFGNMDRTERSEFIRDMSDADVTRYMMFDFIIGQEDRHSDNYMVAEDSGQLVAIDNGFSFIKTNSGKPFEAARAMRKPALAMYNAVKTDRVLDADVMREFAAKESELLATTPEVLYPENVVIRLRNIGRMAESPTPITIEQYWRMLGSGELDKFEEAPAEEST